MLFTWAAACEQGLLQYKCVCDALFRVCWPQYLACLKTSRSQTDKLSFDVGLQEDSTGKRTPMARFAFIHLFPSFILSGCVCLCLSPILSFRLSLNLSLSETYLFTSVCFFFPASQLIFPLENSRHGADYISAAHSIVLLWYLISRPPICIIIYFIPCSRWAVTSIWRLLPWCIHVSKFSFLPGCLIALVVITDDIVTVIVPCSQNRSLYQFKGTVHPQTKNTHFSSYL